MPESEYEHLQDEIKDIDIQPPLEAFENKYPHRDYEIHLEFDEFTCACPKTGLPDFAVITIDYIPDEHIVETKSLKLYLNAYRDLGIFSEHVVNKILDDFVLACSPKFAEVNGSFAPRGGVGINVVASFGKKEISGEEG